MHAASRHGTPSLTSLPNDGGVSCFFGRSSGRSSGIEGRTISGTSHTGDIDDR